MINPYESPRTQDSKRKLKPKPFLTCQRVLWIGLGCILLALAMFTGSQAMFVESKRLGDAWITGVLVIDVIAAVLFMGGLVALAVYHWFPDPTRKYSWHRKHTRNKWGQETNNI